MPCHLSTLADSRLIGDNNTMIPNLNAPTYVATESALHELVAQLQAEALIAVDTESNSLYAYHEQVCLIQFSTRTRDWVVDPLALPDLSVLAPIFSDPRIEKVFHAAEYDLMTMKRDFGFSFANLFDTRIAARIVALKAFGLGALLEDYFEVEVNKRFQRADWSIRPIPPEQLKYAQQDTHFLPALRDNMLDTLREHNRLQEATEAFEALTTVPASEHHFDPDGYWNINVARNFSRPQMAVLRELYLLREKIAEQRDRPPFKVFTDNLMADIVKAAPTTLRELSAIRGMSHPQVDRYGAKLLQAVQTGLNADPPARPDRTPRIDPATLARFDALHEWRKTQALKRGVESDVIVPKEALWALARTVPGRLEDLSAIPGLGPWKRQAYGPALIELLSKFGK